MTPRSRRHDEARRARITRLEQDVADLRDMLERLIAESYTEVGPMGVTVREAQGLLQRTGSIPDRADHSVPDEATIAVTYTHVDRYRRSSRAASCIRSRTPAARPRHPRSAAMRAR